MGIEKHRENCRQYHKEHKIEINERHKILYMENKDYILSRNKEYRDNHKEEISVNKREYYLNHLPEREEYNRTHQDYIKTKQTEYIKSGKAKMTQKNYHLKHPGVAQAYNLKIKTQALTHYGNGKCVCVKCGYDDIRALSIDHINGGGYKERAKKVGVFCYNWLITNNYPDGYQTLCMNCQFIKRMEHKENRWNKNEKI